MALLCYETMNWSPFVCDEDPELEAQIRAAAAAGFPRIGLDAGSIAEHVERGGSVAGLATLVRESGMRCLELQALVVTADAVRTAESAQAMAPLVEAFEPTWVQCAMGAPLGRAAAESLADLAGLVRPARVALEFLPFTPLQTIAQTREILRQAGIRDGGVVVDTWHFFHGPDGWPELQALPEDEIAYIQFNDHPALESDDLYAETIHRRVLPGEGVFDLERFCRIVRDKGYDRAVSLELLSDDMRGWTREDFARRAFRASAPYWS